jgi:transglutaminase-like putative cysteine protease
VQARDFKDAFGNICTRLVAPTGLLEIRNEFFIADSGQPDIVATDAEQWPIDALPDDALTYLLGSRYCDTQKLSNHAWSLFGHIQAGWARARVICQYVPTVFSSDISMPEMTGPRRKDITSVSAYVGTSPHLAIALCRCMCMNIPARYCTGYLGDIGVPDPAPMDFSAWCEVFLGGAGRESVGLWSPAAGTLPMSRFRRRHLARFKVITEELPENPEMCGQMQLRAI